MKLQLEANVIEYLERQGSRDVTLDLEELDSPCCLGRMPEMKITLTPPENPEGYRHISQGGIHLHLSHLIRAQETLTLHLSGFGPFKKLEASGINLIL